MMRIGAGSPLWGGRKELKRYGEGRHIDPEVGLLAGEGAHQQIASERKHPQKTPVPVWNLLPTHRESREPDYYGRPSVKEPVWIWSVPLYFQVGGVAGAAAVLAAALQVSGREDLDGLRRACRWIGAGGAMLGSALLTHDLGRPSRFLKMLRVVRPTSPMSLGSWTLAQSGGILTASLLAETETPLASAGRTAGAAGGLLGIPLAGYTGVLLGNTAVPLWQAARVPLPFLFTGSGAAGLGDLLELLPLEEREKAVARRLGTVGKASELAAVMAVERAASRVPEVSRPLREGRSGVLWRTAKGLIAAGVVVSALSGERRWRRPVAALLGSAGSLLLRFALFEGGKASSQDPQATFRSQRQQRR